MGTLVNGIKEIFATAKTTGSNVMLCGNDGTPDGHMTMANLASVLGANGKGFDDEYVGVDLNTLYTPGVYCLTNGGDYGGSNNPTSDIYTASIVVSADSQGRTQQLLFNINDHTMLVRISGREHSSWGAWRQIYDTSLLTNSTMLGQLANALGALHWVGDITSASQLDTLQAQTIAYLSDSIVVTIGHGTNANYRFQFKLHDSGAIDVRNTTGGDSAWKSWITWFTR